MNAYIGQGSGDGDDATSCLKLWCPAATRFSMNSWICPSDLDPDMATMPTTKDETAPSTEQTTTQDTKQDGGKQDKKEELGNPSPECKDFNTKDYPHGKGCRSFQFVIFRKNSVAADDNKEELNFDGSTIVSA
ncbi:uncharacterized protein LOC142574780 [Dermacentor variabilis]|uniref:uncharacterized protein LOC142574780 n=1 Tax=Dermacentor variabilis TaxID=34621 RepID=UPI003F5BEED8